MEGESTRMKEIERKVNENACVYENKKERERDV